MPPSPDLRTQIGSRAFYLSVAGALALFSLLSSVTFLWAPSGWHLIPSGRYCLPPVIALVVTAFITKSSPNTVASRHQGIVSGSSWGLLLFFVSDWMLRPYSLFPGGTIRGEIVFLGVTCLLLRRFLRNWTLLIFALAFLLTVTAFAAAIVNRQIISDDASTFFYRLSLLRDNFPAIPIYNPLWNAGIDERAFFATGSLNVFFIFSVLIYLIPLELLYSWIVLTLLVLVLPFSIGYATFRITKNYTAAAFSALIALCPSSQWYQWGLTYGALGFITSAALLPLNITLVTEALTNNAPRSWKWVFASTLSISLMLFWSASGLAFLPLIAYALITAKRQLRKKHLLVVGALLCVVNIPWIIAFWQVSKVSSFLHREPIVKLEPGRPQENPKQEIIAIPNSSVSQNGTVTEPILIPSEDAKKNSAFRHRKGEVNIERSLHLLRSGALSTNPLLILLAVAGCFVLPLGVASLLAATGLWLLSGGTVLVPLIPQLELDRMLVLCQLLGCIPAGCALALISQRPAGTSNLEFLSQLLRAIPPVLCYGYLSSGILVACSILSNKTFPRTTFLDTDGQNLVAFLRQQPTNGRYLFSGCVTHHLDGGHLSSLSVRTEKPLVASSPFGDIWWYTDVFPKTTLIQGMPGILKHLDLMNVNGVFAHEPHYRKLFRSFPEHFKETWQNDTFTYFERTNPPKTYFLEGDGQIIKQSNSEVVLRLTSGAAVVKFRYLPHLKTSACELSKHDRDGISLISLNACPIDTPVTIKAQSILTRVFGIG